MSPPTTYTDLPFQLDDLLQMAGDEKLGGFVWGKAVCEELNTFLSKERQITLDHTGNKALIVVRSLPIQTLPTVMAIRINPKTGERVDSIQRAPEYERYAQRPLDSSRASVDDPKNSLHGKIMLLLAGVMAVVVIALTYATINNSDPDRPKIESSTLEVALKVMGDIFISTADNESKKQRESRNNSDSHRDNREGDSRRRDDPPPRYRDEPSYGN